VTELNHFSAELHLPAWDESFQSSLYHNEASFRVSKIFRTDAVKIINITTKRVWKLPTPTQLRATWHTDSLDMVVLPSTGVSRYQNCCIDGGTSPEYFGYTLVCRCVSGKGPCALRTQGPNYFCVYVNYLMEKSENRLYCIQLI
jgi:hypothetical protein